MRDNGQRVVITGMGVISVLGEDTTSFLSALLAGRSGITCWKSYRDHRHYSRIGGDLSDFDLSAHLEKRDALYPADLTGWCRALMRAAPRVPRLVAAAALQAYHQSGLMGTMPPERTGHVLAGHNLNAGYIVENSLTFYDDEPDYIEPLFGLLCLDTDVLSSTSELLGIKGPSFTVGGACASGNVAIAAAVDLLRSGQADAVVVSGAPIELEPVALHGWALIDALSIHSFNDDPQRASRPFDRLREGFVPAEGAGALVLETLKSARSRNADILAEVLGVSRTSDASRLTRPDLDGQVRAIRLAMEDAGVERSDIDYVNAHATSTPLGDAVEVAAIRYALGDHAERIPINSTKSMIGHCLSAAGVLELIATVLQMREGIVHPTINQEEPDPELTLDFVPNISREHRIEIALSNSFGFGGINSSVVLGRAGR